MSDVESKELTDTPDTPQPRKRLSIAEALLIAWRQLTAMRTALLLLFLLAFAAIPGSLIPQRPTSPLRVRDFAAQNPELATWYDRLGLFDVFASPWFAAIYLLLFVSLIGCILPRIRVYAKALRAQPPSTPRHLTRLPESIEGTVAGDPSVALDAAEKYLRGKRWRVRRESDSLSAERGYLREAGNLVFHLSLVVLLLGLAWTNLLGYRGTAVVVVGGGFTNTLTQYDELTAGGGFDASQLEPFTMSLNSFTVEFETGPVQRGAAREFDARVTVTTPDGTTSEQQLQVNQPLQIGDTEVHLLGHGYAPVVTVRDGSGNIAYSGPVVFLPQDGNFTSSGVIKVPDARPNQLAFEGLFLPTAVIDAKGPRSLFPDALVPQLVLNAWYGAPTAATGDPESVYSLDTTGLTQFQTDGSATAFRLSPGETFTLPSSGGSISFDGYQRWIKIQVSRTPGAWLSLVAVGFAVAGLCASLFVRPRRLWIRIGDDGTATAAGLDKADSRTGLADDVDALLNAAGGVRRPTEAVDEDGNVQDSAEREDDG